jgi:hypothetical protein
VHLLADWFPYYDLKMDHDADVYSDRRLRSMLTEAGMHVKHAGVGSYEVSFPSRLREWSVRVTLADVWVLLRTFVMTLPADGPRRLALLEAAMQINGRLSLAKLSVVDATSLCLELEYRSDHVDSDVLRNLVGLLVKVGDREYPQLFRIATGDTALDALESAFNRSPNEE